MQGLNTNEDGLAEWVDSVKQSPDRRDSLVEFLPEQSPVYSGRSTNETTRMRGYILAAFEQVGLPDSAIPYVLDELENGRDAYLVAGAAKALRGLPRPDSAILPFLFKAIENIKYIDDALTFDIYKPQWPLANYTTALNEIFATFGWLGSEAQEALPGLQALYEDQIDFSPKSRAEIINAIDAIRTADRDVTPSCCAIASPFLSVGISQIERRGVASVADIEFEDQDGSAVKFGEFFNGAPSIVVFFYSRCDNPNKCSLTITKLAGLQRAIKDAGLDGQLKTAAITYDPGYDLPSRLKAYGENRGVAFGDSDRFLRARTGFKELQEYFDLGVNFGDSTVNRHRIELFILDDKGNITATFARLQWDPGEVLTSAKAVFEESESLQSRQETRTTRHSPPAIEVSA